MFESTEPYDQRLHRRLKWAIAVTAILIVTGAALLLGLARATSHHQEMMSDAAEDLRDTQQLSIAITVRAAAVRNFQRTGELAQLSERADASREIDGLLARLLADSRHARELGAIRDLARQVDAALDAALGETDDPVRHWEQVVVPVQTTLRERVLARVRAEQLRFDRVRDGVLAASRQTRELLIALVVVCLLGLGLAASILVRTGRLLVQRQRAEQEHRLRQLLDQIPVGIVVANLDGSPAYANRQALSIMNASPPTVEAIAAARECVFELGTDRRIPTSRMPLLRALAGEHVEANDVELRRPDGEVVPLHLRAAPVRDRDGKQLCAVSAFQDVRELLKMGGRDALTGLMNRAAIEPRFTRERLLAERGRRALSVAIIDLDRFKSINDTHGHAAGDRVLRETARAIASTLRRTDIVARWGGEELVIALPDTDARRAGRAIEKALDAVRALAFEGADGQPFSVTFSAGVVAARTGEGLETAVARADGLLYAAKAGGRDRVLVEPSACDDGWRRASSARISVVALG
ncbi:MAG: diguanylate cyclase [Kofleriaceae bacterium]